MTKDTKPLDWQVRTWWILLSSVQIVNLLVWPTLAPGEPDVATEQGVTRYRFQSRQWILCGVFTAVCAFRSFLLRIDLERYVMFRVGFLSSMVAGRSGATIAELCFAAQAALTLDHVGEAANMPIICFIATCIVPILAIAQVCCWYSVLTLNHLGHAIEESLWDVTHAVICVCFIVARPHLSSPELQYFVSIAIVLLIGYCLFMTFVDVPMYIRRWQQGKRDGTRYLSITDGWNDALVRQVQISSWDTWQPEVAWLSGYFTCAVWCSQAMINVPN
jgi:hypothetical protein